MKVAVSLQQIVSITKEMDVSKEQIDKKIITFTSDPKDRPVVKNVFYVFGEDGNLLFSTGRDENAD